jgi:predicted DNA-binding ribbon-helix-helix protein
LKIGTLDLKRGRTSIRLEPAFWAVLKAAASAEGVTISTLITRIDEQRCGPLTSAVRVWVLGWALTQPGG